MDKAAEVHHARTYRLEEEVTTIATRRDRGFPTAASGLHSMCTASAGLEIGVCILGGLAGTIFPGTSICGTV